MFSSLPEVPSQLLHLCSGQFSSLNMPSSTPTTPKKVTDLNQSSLQRKDSKDLPTTQGLRELLGSQETNSKPSSKPKNNISSLLGTSTCEDDGSQLLALCSGKFSTQLVSFHKGKLETSDGLSNDNSSSDNSEDDLMGLTRGKSSSSGHVANGLLGHNDNSDDEMPRLSKRKNRKYLKNRERNIKR